MVEKSMEEQRDHALDVLRMAQWMLTEYYEYGEKMRARGLGFHPSGITRHGYHERTANLIIADTLHNHPIDGRPL